MQIRSLRFQDIKTHFPIKTMLIIIGVWLVLALGNFLSIEYGVYLGVDLFFPFSVLYPSEFLWQGFIFSFLFGVAGVYCWDKVERFSLLQVLLCCILLVFLGNMMQGSFDNAFLKPFYWKGQQYYSDAIKVTDAADFLRTFEEKQDTFLLHTKTHPPFVVLIHYYLLQISGGSIVFLSLVFTGFAMLIFPIMMRIWQNFDFPALQIKKLLLLLAIVPSVNIYTLVSLDGLILVSVALALWAVSEVYKVGKVSLFSIILTVLSIVISNSLSFSGLFVIAFLGILALVQLWKRDARFAWLGGISLMISILVFLGYYYIGGYNHWEVFRAASASENRYGFMLFSIPHIYFATRLQDIAEIMMFLSLPFITLWFDRKYSASFLEDSFTKTVAYSAIFVLLLMFSTGAYGTGETARACLFIVPFIFILVRKIPAITFTIVYFLCVMQTLIMQTVGNFFW